MINQLSPSPAKDLSDEHILDLYSYPETRPWVRFNFIASLDGSASYQGVSAPLGNDGDRRLFGLIRRLCDVIVVGAGTVRAEGYAGELVNEKDSQWRQEHGYSLHPALAVISGTLDLDPTGELFERSPVRPIIFTAAAAPNERLEALREVADVVVCGEKAVDAHRSTEWLQERGLGRILCEGGPGVFGSFIAQDQVDELCLSVSPLLTAGQGSALASHGDHTPLRRFTLASLLEADSALYGRWIHASAEPGDA
ncbi:pyrimidine reductase family protein [Arthrobacter tecti]